jgi:glycine/serine hydroxymethyltransferase
MGPDEMAQIAQLIDTVLRHRDDEDRIATVRKEVVELCSAFAPYPGLEY